MCPAGHVHLLRTATAAAVCFVCFWASLFLLGGCVFCWCWLVVCVSVVLGPAAAAAAATAAAAAALRCSVGVWVRAPRGGPRPPPTAAPAVVCFVFFWLLCPFIFFVVVPSVVASAGWDIVDWVELKNPAVDYRSYVRRHLE